MNYEGEIAAMLTACSWAITSIIFAEASRRIGSATVNIMRLIIALFMLTSIIAVLGISFRFNNYHIIYLGLSGIVGLLIGDSFLYMTYKLIGPRLGALLLALAPPIAAIFSYIFLGETLNITAVIGILLTVSGISLAILQKKPFSDSKITLDRRGVLFGILAAAGQAVGLMLSKKAFEFGSINSFTANFIRLIFATIFFIPIVTRFKDFQNPFKIKENRINNFLLVFAGAVFGPFIGITLSLYSVSKTSVGVASAIMATVPVLLLPMVKYYYKEQLGYKAVIGALLAVLGVALLFMR